MALTNKARLPPEASLAPSLQGGAIQLTGAGDRGSLISLREAADGVIVNGANLLNTQVTDSVIDISMCSLIGLFISITIGSLTSADIFPEFADFKTATWFRLLSSTLASNISTLVPHKWRFTATGAGVVWFPNPGAGRMRVWIDSAGTDTGSSAIVRVGRSWSPPHAMIGH